MTSRSVTVVNALGIHARAAAKLVHLAATFESRIRVGRMGREMDGKSIMGILLLAAARGMTITISADGADEAAAVAALGGDGGGRVRGGRMQRLTGIGVSSGVGCGRAVILIQRASGGPLSDRAGEARARDCAPRAEPGPRARTARRHPHAGGQPARNGARRHSSTPSF